MAKESEFQDWLRQVDLELAKCCGFGHDDLTDQPWRDRYDDGLTPGEAATECLVNEGLPGLDESEGRT